MLSPKVCYIFQTRRPTKFILGTHMEHDDPYHWQSGMTSKVKGQGRDVTWSVWQVLAHKSRMKSTRNTKISRNVAHLQYCAPVSRSKGQSSRSPGTGRQFNARVAGATWLIWNVQQMSPQSGVCVCVCDTACFLFARLKQKKSKYYDTRFNSYR